MKRLRPVLLLGLGRAGDVAGRAIYDRLIEQAPALAPAIRRISLLESGMRDGLTSDELKLPVLESSRADGVFQRNYDTLLAAADGMEPWMTARLGELLRQDLGLKLEDHGYTLDSTVSVLLVTSLADAVGSAAILPMLTILQAAITGSLRGTVLDISILGVFPDAMEDEKEADDAYGRAYVCLQELEYAAEHPSVVGILEQPPFAHVLLFSGRNEDGTTTAGFEPLLHMIGEFCGPFLRRDFGADTSYSVALSQEVDQRVTRYSSFGLAMLIFPVAQVMKALADHHLISISRTYVGDTPGTFHIDGIAAAAREFVGSTGLDALVESGQKTDEGAAIRRPFRYGGSTEATVPSREFLEDVERATTEYSRSTAATMSQLLAARRESLFVQHTRFLQEKIDKGLDRETAGIYRELAFLDVMLDTPSPYTHDQGTAEPWSITTIAANAKAFFDKQHGIDREALARVRRDIADKTAHLASLQSAHEAHVGPFGEVAPSPEVMELLKEELRQLQMDRVTMQAHIAAFDARIADAAHRRQMLEELRNRAASARSELSKKLDINASELAAAELRLEDLLVARRKLLLSVLLTAPLAIASTFAALTLGYATLRGLTWADTAARYAGVAAAAAIGYAGFGSLRYILKLAPQLRQARLAISRKRAEKRRLMWDIEQSYTAMFDTEFDHELHGGLIGWLDRYRNSVREVRAKLGSFVDTVTSTRDAATGRLAELRFASSPLSRSAVSAADVERFLARNTRVSHEEAAFIRDHPLSTIFARFTEDGDLRDLEHLIDVFAGQLHNDVRTCSIDQILKELVEDDGALRVKLNSLVQASKAFIHLDVESGMDGSQTLLFVGTATDEPSPVKSMVKQLGGPAPDFYSTGDRYSIRAARLKVGFPAFHVSLVRHGRRVAQKAAPAAFAIQPEWALTDLVPSTVAAGAADDPARTLLRLGLVFGIVKEGAQGDLTVNETIIGRSLEEAVATLRRPSGAKVRNILTTSVESAKHEDRALERLLSARRIGAADPVDAEIIQRAIDELDPIA